MLLTLWQAAGTSPSITDTIADIRHAIESTAFVLVAEVDQRIVGSLIATFDGWRGNMYRIAVHPDYQRRGIGQALVAKGERCLTKQGALNASQHSWKKSIRGRLHSGQVFGYEIEPGIVRFFRNP